MDDLRLCFLGSGVENLDEEILERIGEIDVLFIGNGLELKKTVSLIKDLDPRLVICRKESDTRLLSKELGQSAEIADKIVVKKKDLNEEETKLVCLTSKEK
jgi:hypothetical protein